MSREADEERVDEQGVDLTLVRYTLSLTPTERLKALENFMNAMASVRPSCGRGASSVIRSGSSPRSDWSS